MNSELDRLGGAQKMTKEQFEDLCNKEKEYREAERY